MYTLYREGGNEDKDKQLGQDTFGCLLFREGQWIGGQYFISLWNLKAMINPCILKTGLSEVSVLNPSLL